MKLGMLSLQDKEMLKNVIKRGGHRACFHATILTNMVIFVTFGYLSAQQISSTFFSMQRFISHSLTFFDCLFVYVPENTLHFLDMRFSALYVSPCRVYFICQKGSHRFLLSNWYVAEKSLNSIFSTCTSAFISSFLPTKKGLP